MNRIKNLSINKKDSALTKNLVKTAVFLFVLFAVNIFLSPIKNYFYEMSSPVQKTFFTAGAVSSDFLGSIFKTGRLANENAELKNKNLALLSQLALLRSQGQQGELGQAMDILSKEKGLKFLAASVIGMEGDGVISLDKGLEDGIAEGMAVVNENLVVFGKIEKVYKKFSRVSILSSSNSVINVRVQPKGGEDNTKIVGVVRGGGNMTAYLDLIQIDKNIDSGDIILTSSIEKSFPKDLLVGEVSQKRKNDQEPFQQAGIRLFLDLKSADNLFVLTNFKQEE